LDFKSLFITSFNLLRLCIIRSYWLVNGFNIEPPTPVYATVKTKAYKKERRKEGKKEQRKIYEKYKCKNSFTKKEQHRPMKERTQL